MKPVPRYSPKNPDPSLEDPQGNIIAACRVGGVQSMEFLKYYHPIIEQCKKPGCLGYILITVYILPSYVVYNELL